MKLLKTLTIFIFLCLPIQQVWGVVTPENKMNILHQGNNFMKLKIDPQKYDDLFKADSPDDLGLIDSKLVKDKEIYVFYSLAGVLESDIHQSLKDEILQDEGFNDWNKISQRDLNSPLIIALDIKIAMQKSTKSEFNTKGPCRKVWKEKRKTISNVLTPNSKQIFDVSRGGVTGSLNVNLNASGSQTLDIHYKMKKNKCIGIYYKVKHEYTRIRANSNLSGSGIGLSANVAYEFDKDLFKEDVKIQLLEPIAKSWWVYFFELELAMEVYAEYNVSLDAKLSTAFEIEQPMTGHINIDWHCTNDGCRKDINDVEYDFTSITKRNFEVVADVTLRPYLKLVTDVAVGLYWDLIDIAKVEVGLVGSIPARYYGYYGNMCSDVDGDGNNEEVRASLVDVAAELYMYYKCNYSPHIS